MKRLILKPTSFSRPAVRRYLFPGDHIPGFQPCVSLGPSTQRGEHFVRMLADQRRAMKNTARRRGLLLTAVDAIVSGVDDPGMLDLRQALRATTCALGNASGRVDGSEGTPPPPTRFSLGARSSPFFDEGHRPAPMGKARVIRGEFWIVTIPADPRWRPVRARRDRGDTPRHLPVFRGNMPNGQSRGCWLPSGTGTLPRRSAGARCARTSRGSRQTMPTSTNWPLAGLVGAQDARRDDAEGGQAMPG